MTEINKESSKTVLNSFGRKFKKSKMAFKVAFVANSLGVLAFVLCLLRIFSLYAVITFGVCTLIAFFAYGVLAFDTLKHRTK